MPDGAPFAFMPPHMPFQHPICLLAQTFTLMTPHLLLWCHICLLAPHVPFASPIQPHDIHLMCTFWYQWQKVRTKGPSFIITAITPNFFFFNSHNYVGQPKGIMVSHSQGEFMMISVAMNSSIFISSTNWLTWLHLGFGISNLQSSLPFCTCQHVPQYPRHQFVRPLKRVPLLTATWT